MRNRDSCLEQGKLSSVLEPVLVAAVWDKLLAKRVTCQALKEADFDVLGDYFMGQMMGGFHAAMDQTMVTRLGDAGEMQMHIKASLTIGSRCLLYDNRA